jgi:hypothetical protein
MMTLNIRLLKTHPLRSMWLFVVLVLASSSVATNELTIIDLQQRLAQEMVPLIQPFLKPGDSLVGRDYSLFIRTDPDTLAQVRRMLASLDRPAVSLMISVRHGHQRQGYDRRLGTRGAVVVRDGDVDDTVAIHGRDRAGRYDGSEVQRVRALSGEPAFIQTGISVVQPDYGLRIGRDGTRVYRSYGRQDLTGGLYATVQLQDNGRIRVELDSRDTHPRVGRYGRIGAAVQNLSTVVTGRLGEWIPLGGVSRWYSGSARGLASAGAGGGSADDPVYIKVDRVD